MDRELITFESKASLQVPKHFQKKLALDFAQDLLFGYLLLLGYLNLNDSFAARPFKTNEINIENRKFKK